MLCIAKQLAEKLKSIKLHRVNREYNSVAHSENWKQFYIGESCINGELKYSLGSFDEPDFKYSLDYVLSALATSIGQFSNCVRFNSLTIPRKGIEELGVNIYGDVWVRAVTCYIPQSDMLVTRYDVLIEKVTENA